jgi:phospholipase C
MMMLPFIQLFTAMLFILTVLHLFWGTSSNIAYSLLPEEANVVNKHIKHFIVIIQGRHTFDNYFGTFPGADGFPKNASVPLDPFEPDQSTYAKPFHIDGEVNYKARDDPPTYRLSYNNGSMNGFILAQKNNTGNPINVMGYFDNRDIPYYWKFASEYVLAQRFFSPSMRSDLVNSLYAIDANPSLRLQDVPIQGLEINRTIFDSLEAEKIPWRVYVEDLGHIYDMSNEDTLILKRNIPILAIPRFIDNQSLKSNIHDLSNYFDDILSNRLANVSYLYFTGSNDSPTTNVIPAQELVANLVYALMRSQYWNSSAILLTHNEAGGWYDHVKPPINNNTGELSGFRVPAIIISPYVKRGHFDSNTYDIKAFLDIIQSSLGINNTINGINHTNIMYSAFDFAQKPRQPLLIQEIPKERVTIQPEEINGINTVYVVSLLAPIIVTTYWYYWTKRHNKVKGTQ